MFAKFGLEVLYSNDLWVPPFDDTQAVQQTKITYNVLFKVMNPYVPLKSKLSKIAYEAVTFQRIVQKAMFAKFGMEVLYSNDLWIRPFVSHQEMRGTKLTFDVLFKVRNPYIPLKSKLSKISYEAVSFQRIMQQARFAKFGHEVVYLHHVRQLVKWSKLAMETLTCIEPYKIDLYPIGDWYDANWPWRQMITVDGTAIPTELSQEWVGILYDVTSEAIFGKNNVIHVSEPFDNTSLINYQINESIPGSLYVQNGELVIHTGANQYAHLHVDSITNRNMEIQAKIKVIGVNSGDDLAPGIGLW